MWRQLDLKQLQACRHASILPQEHIFSPVGVPSLGIIGVKLWLSATQIFFLPTTKTKLLSMAGLKYSEGIRVRAYGPSIRSKKICADHMIEEGSITFISNKDSHSLKTEP